MLWWKYAINSVIKLQREKKGFINAFKIPKTRMRDYEVNFMKLFQKYLDKQPYNENELHHIIIAVDQAHLEKWVTVLTKQRIDNAEKKSSESSWFGGFFGNNSKNEEDKAEEGDISAEEIEQVYKQLYQRFLANDDQEEAKGFNNVKSVSVELIVKNGGVNLRDDRIDVNLFFKNSGFSLTQYTDESMSVEAQTKDFGLRMNSDQVFEVIEKMDESEVFWDMKYVQYSPKSDIDYSLNLKVNPIKFVYEGIFVKFLVNFFTNDSDLQIQEQAAEKWVDFKEGAQQQIQESMKAGRNDIKINISSPILLIPLRHNDRNSNLWAINLGDFSLTSENMEENYE